MATTYQIVPAGDDATRTAIFRFRYDVYVTEMRRRQSHADHAQRLIIDPLDESGYSLAAFSTQDPSRIVGTVRMNLLRHGPVGIYEDLYRLHLLTPAARERTSITTRFMVAPDHRGGPLALLLASSLYRWGIARGIVSDYIDCNPPLVPFFKRLGYYDVGRAEHPEYGSVHVMRIVREPDYLAEIGSPLLTEVYRESTRRIADSRGVEGGNRDAHHPDRRHGVLDRRHRPRYRPDAGAGDSETGLP